MAEHGLVDVEPSFEPRQHPSNVTATGEEPAKWHELADGAPRAVHSQTASDQSAAADRMVAIARDERERGVAESPQGSNRGIPLERYVHYFDKSLGPVPWCAFFVSWSWDQATDKNRRVPWSNPGLVASVHAWAKQAGRLVSQPVHGDLFGGSSDDHMGIVVGSDPQSRIIFTVEGNYSGKVAGVSRPWSGLWFARLM